MLEIGDLVWAKWVLDHPVEKRKIGLIVGVKDDMFIVEWTGGLDTLSQHNGGYFHFNLVRIS